MNELEIKTERLVQMLNAENLGGVLLNSQHNFAWLTSGGNNGVDLSQSNGVASLLVRNDGKRFVLASKIEMPRILAEELSSSDFEPIEYDWDADKIDGGFVPKTAVGLLHNKTLGTDIFYFADFRVIEGQIAKCRFQLTDDEITRFRQLGQDTGLIFEAIPQKIHQGMSELEIAKIVRTELFDWDINSVVTLVAADQRITKFRHPIPTTNRWERRLMIVVCAKRGGLIASASRIFSIGKINNDLRLRTDSVARVHAEMMNATRPGVLAKDIFQITRNAYSATGFPGEELKHHQGGACGYKTRDWVAQFNSTEEVLLNQAFAWNPSISGTKSEETFITTKDGIEVITASPNFPAISNVIAGIEYKTPDILEL